MLRVDYWISRLESSYLEKFVVLILTELKTKQTNLKWQLKTLTVELGGLFKILLDFWLIMKWNRHWLSINDSVWILSGFLRMLKRPFAFLRYRWANWRQRTKIDVVDVASATKSQPPSAATARKSALESYCNYFFFFQMILATFLSDSEMTKSSNSWRIFYKESQNDVSTSSLIHRVLGFL